MLESLTLPVVSLLSIALTAGPNAAADPAAGARDVSSPGSSPSPGRFVTENVKSNPTMPQSHVEHDVRAGASLGDVLLWQEISPPRYKAAVEHLPDRWRTVRDGTEDPISFDTSTWHLVTSGRKLLSRGRAHVTPDRWATWAALQNVATRRVLVFMDTHYVSSAWNDRPVPHKAWRRRTWKTEWNRQDALVDELHGRGFTIMGGGDFNRVTLPRFGAGQVDLNSGSIDHLWVLPGAANDVDPGDASSYRQLYSDHDAVVGRFTVQPVGP
jgi:hypothetical protein